MLDGFFLSQANSVELLQAHSDTWLVTLSLFISVISAGVALRLASMAQSSQGMAHKIALLSASLVLGSGIWTMHFVGMLAFDLCRQVQYDLVLTLVSMGPSLLASWITLRLLSRPKITTADLFTGGLWIGLGICGMHYTGMASMQMLPLLRYDPVWFGVSLLVAITLSILALWLRFALKANRSWSQKVGKLTSILFMGSAISGMHYTAMAAARFVGSPEMIEGSGAASARSLAMTVAGASFTVMGVLALLCSLLRYRALWLRVESNEQRLQSMIDMAVDGIITIDGRGCIQVFNPAAEAIFGWTSAETVGRNVSMLMPSPLAEQHDGYLEHYQRSGEKRPLGSKREVLGLHKNGRHLQLKLSLKKVQTPDGLLFVGFMTDLSERKKNEARLRIAASVYEHSYEGILVLDAHYRALDLNPAYQRMIGLSRVHCLGRALEELYPADAFSPSFEAVRRMIATNVYWQGEIETGAIFHRMSISAVLDDQQRIQHYIVVATDLSQEKIREQELAQIALYDDLTGLPNQRLLNDRLLQSIHVANKDETLLAVVYIDLDIFKQVNDKMGAAKAELLMGEICHRLRSELRAEDTAARVDKDEIVLLLGDWNSPLQTATIIERLLETIAQPVVLPQGACSVTASIGVSIFPLDAQTPDQLLKQADSAMYEAKQQGENQFRRYHCAHMDVAESALTPASLACAAMGASLPHSEAKQSAP